MEIRKVERALVVREKSLQDPLPCINKDLTPTSLQSKGATLVTNCEGARRGVDAGVIISGLI